MRNSTPPSLRRLLLGLAALLAVASSLSACTPDWSPESRVETFRALAIASDPPELAPGQSAHLKALTFDAENPNRPSTVLWGACDPDPSRLVAPACADLASYGDGSVPGLAGLPPGVITLSAEGSDTPFREATYHAPANLFDGIDPSDARRQTGVIAYIVAIAIPRVITSQSDLLALMPQIQSGAIPSITMLKRIRVLDQPTNQNPVITGVTLDGTSNSDPTATLKLPPGKHELVGNAGPPETYSVRDPVTGELHSREEQLSFAWFATRGDFDHTMTLAEAPLEFRFEQPPAADRRGTLFALLRDGRNGISWSLRRFIACDPQASAITLVGTTPTTGPVGSEVLLSGPAAQLAQGIEVRASGVALDDARYDAPNNVWRATLSALPVGPTRLELIGPACTPDEGVDFVVTPGP